MDNPILSHRILLLYDTLQIKIDQVGVTLQKRVCMGKKNVSRAYAIDTVRDFMALGGMSDLDYLVCGSIRRMNETVVYSLLTALLLLC